MTVKSREIRISSPVSCSESCYTGWYTYTTCTYYCCESSTYGYDYCCYSKSSYNYDYTYTTSTSFAYWIIAPIVIGAVVFIAGCGFIIRCFCMTVNGKTHYQAWSHRRVGATSVEITSSVNQQQSTMNSYPQQLNPQAYPMYPQPYSMGQQPYGMVPQYGFSMQPGGSQPAVPPPYSSEQGK
ncbi:uncharacterized protein LOC127860232 isoform X2 [Dreissena polymorpha]|uniref:uncharacterized protein LOC127860232 isoform X2 n=1 Tax=Dreissena polymorpha TaxID=45954 RepID=UPI0022644CD2|nr:uncharacterized protein LOC127860232 isoform X2 [Dreissena polymorpha]